MGCKVLVITDVIMPDKNGLQIITELRATAPAVKVIAMSSGGSDHNGDFLAFAEELGAAATISKPFELADIKAVLEKIGK